jgi:hypothetical protein
MRVCAPSPSRAKLMHALRWLRGYRDDEKAQALRVMVNQNFVCRATLRAACRACVVSFECAEREGLAAMGVLN